VCLKEHFGHVMVEFNSMINTLRIDRLAYA
jgi:hypothetical protein